MASEQPERPATLKRAPRAAPDEQTDPVDVAAPAASEPAAPVRKKRGPYNVKKVDKKPATFRLPPDVHDLIDQARTEAAQNGDRLTKDEVIIQAVRAHWGKKRRRR
ncbi:MAG: hypothetical protein ACTH07_05435 [Microbacterium sp.]